jgi:hypothetical protein
MNAIANVYLVNYPQINTGSESFSFESTNALGNFTFTFKWLNGQWNGWCTLPTSEVRQFGCVPDVVDWTGFSDYGIFIDSSLPILGVDNLVGNSTLYVIAWKVPS